MLEISAYQCRMDNRDETLNQKLKDLMSKACAAPRGSPLRQKCLTQVVELVQQSGRLYRSYSPFYPDALQETWFRVFRTPENYQPEKGEVSAWINSTLKFRLRDEINKDCSSLKVSHDFEHYFNLLETIPSHPQVPPMLEETLRWIKSDPKNILKDTAIKSRPDINAQLMLMERFPPETKWNLLAQRFKIPRSTLVMFYERKCLPLLRAFGEEQGYL